MVDIFFSQVLAQFYYCYQETNQDNVKEIRKLNPVTVLNLCEIHIVFFF